MIKFRSGSLLFRTIRPQHAIRTPTTSRIYLNKQISTSDPNATSSNKTTRPVQESAKKGLNWKKYIQIFTLLGATSCGLYVFSDTFMDQIPSDYMTPYTFTPFIVSNKLDIDADHYLIELTPKFNKWKQQKPQIWNGHKLWSVEIKQPQIMVVRKYTPLPLLINKEASKVVIQSEQDYNDGKLTFYIKKYSQGEVARWISRKSIGSELELRGPFIEYEFPADSEQPLNEISSENKPDPLTVEPNTIAFFSAGTGIAPLLQFMLSSNSPLVHVKLYQSRRTESELKPFQSILCSLIDMGRLEMTSFVNPHRLCIDDIPIKKSNFTRINEEISKVIICGTDGFVRDIAGLKPYEGQGFLGGWLKTKGWDKEDVFKM